MSSIRLHIVFRALITFSTVGWLSYLTNTSYREYVQLNQNLQESYELINLAQKLHELPFKDSTLETLKRSSTDLQPTYRMEVMNQVVHSYANRNKKLMKKGALQFSRAETQYRKSLYPKIDSLREKVKIYGLASLGTTLLALLLLFSYIQRTIFQPLKHLSHKMVEFLNDRYTYQFRVLKPNEVGRLQANFNALAQKVISNRDELKSLDHAKSEFLSIASHELRTPLTSIKGSLSLLKSGIAGELTPQGKHLFTIAETETDRLIRLISEILDLAKIEARKFPLDKKWASLPTLVNQTCDAMMGLSQAAQVQIIPKNIPDVEIHVDPSRIQQVLTNLLSNAIKHSPRQSCVTLSCQVQTKSCLTLEITDQGKGIAPEDQELIFEKFRQATSLDNPLVTGTGLGLAIAKAIIEEHRGSIGLRSTLSKGSTFYLNLPQWRPHIGLDQEVSETIEVAL